MSIIEKIKQMWLKNDKKDLPPPKKENNNIKKSWLVGNYEKDHQKKQVDQDICNFLQAYHDQINQNSENQSISNYELAYTAIATMNGSKVTPEEYNINQKNENKLLNDEEICKKYTFQIQKIERNGFPVFFHVKSINYKMPEFKDMMRIYLNCSNKNIAELATIILNFNRNPNFYMKVVTNEQNKEKNRGEKIVIYCHKDELESNISFLEYLKKIRPDLFKESEKTLPFLKNIKNMVSISKQPEIEQYTSLQGKVAKMKASTNAFLATILRESYMVSAWEIAQLDKRLSFLLDERNISNENLYVKNFPYINYHYHDYLIERMKEKMAILGKKNNIYIEGIYTPQIMQNKNNERENRENGQNVR